MNFLENKQLPKVGQAVYAVVGFEQRVVCGKVRVLSNIDNRGLANTYLDIDVTDKEGYHIAINQAFDHEPKKVQTEDEFGSTSVWR